MKKYMILFCLALLFPAACFAGIYENTGLNIHLDIPDTWNITSQSFASEPNGMIAVFETGGLNNILMISGKNAEDMKLGTDDTWKTRFASPDVEKKMLGTVLEARKQKQPGVYFRSSEIVTAGGNVVMLTKASHLGSDLAGYAYTEANILRGGRMYIFTLSTNDKSQTRQDEFMKMVGSFRPLS